MDPSQTSSARRGNPGTTAGIRCVIAFFLLMAFALTSATLFMVFAPDDLYSVDDIAGLIAFGLSFSLFLVLISVGLYRHRRAARWAAVVTSLCMAIGGSVIGIVLFLYLIRPEHDGRFG